jgi:uncharacterized membrane protein YagU involved in acid resistance
MNASTMDTPAVDPAAPGTLDARPAAPPRPASALTALIAGFAAATIDIVFAFAFFGWQLGVTPQRVLQSVASGLLGTDAFTGGAAAAAVGFVAHYAILIVAAAIYVLATRRLPALNRHAVASGVAFGIAIYVAMTFVIVPLSAAHMRPLTLNGVTIGQFLIHPVLGLAIALIVRARSR